MSDVTYSPTTPAQDIVDVVEVSDAPEQKAPGVDRAAGTLFRVLAAVSFCHLLNDMVQSLVPSIYPILKSSFHLNFSQLGFLTLTYQIVASLLQPFVGQFTDKRPMPFALAIGMTFTLVGLVRMGVAPTF